MRHMRRCLTATIVVSCAACAHEAPPSAGEYLFVWAGDSAGAASDFLGVIDASPSSATYGSVIASLPTGGVQVSNGEVSDDNVPRVQKPDP